MAAQFIVFDGNEGCGKSTQIALLRDRLVREGRDVLLVRDPGTTRHRGAGSGDFAGPEPRGDGDAV